MSVISVVIPTKNRLPLLIFALESVLNQKYPFMEIIIADNSDNEEILNYIASIQDVRIKYYRTGSLSLQDNWQYGISKTEGEYVILLRDKVALKSDSITLLSSILKSQNFPDWVSWGCDNINPLTGHYSYQKNGNYEIININTNDIIKSIGNGKWREIWDFIAPQESAIKKDLLIKIIEHPPNKLFFGAVGDIGLAYQLLINTNTIIHVNGSLMTGLFPMNSIGYDCATRSPKFIAFLESGGYGINDCIKHVPLKFFSCLNSTYNDLIEIDSIRGVKIIEPMINLRSYYSMIYKEMIETLFFGNVQKKEILQLESSIKELDPYLYDELIFKYQKIRKMYPLFNRVFCPLIAKGFFFPSQIINKIIDIHHTFKFLTKDQRKSLLLILVVLKREERMKRLESFYSKTALKYLRSNNKISKIQESFN
ncbi:glycosyltransferase family 2 protein [uncultured Methanospirillum sp.]|uniref:glycosyltransferase family 2 protein n=1 Tax=uncultured Methanospirillum sp. TaxID=262503 RepID=UPI0029C8C141|nr:glycosyltransferase family 2 protein [uncultured Methanospirillum sp.]